MFVSRAVIVLRALSATHPQGQAKATTLVEDEADMAGYRCIRVA